MSKKKRRPAGLPGEPFKVSHGHLPHMSGSGRHDSRPRRRRDRAADKRASIRDARED